MSRHILIAGGGLVNKGAEAMVRSVQHGLLPLIDDAEGLLATSSDYPEDKLRGLVNWHNPFGSRVKSAQFALPQALGLLGRWPFRSTLEWYAQTGTGARIDAVIDISGYAYHDRAGQRRSKLRRLVRAHRVGVWDIFSLLGVPTFYMPQAWGPFSTAEGRTRADRVIRGASAVFARDAYSYECLQQLPSFSEAKVRIASDIAFTFRGDSEAVGQSLLGGLGCAPDGSPLIGIVPSMRVYERTPQRGSDSSYVRCLCAIAEHFIREHDARVVLMPHEIRPGGAGEQDDRYLCRIISEELAPTRAAFAATDDYTAEQLKSMIGRMDLMVSSRFHAIVAALSLRRPVVAVSWSHKYWELLQSVGLGEFVHTDDNLEAGALVELCAHAWSEREQLTALLEQHVPEHERSAENAIRDVAKMISDAPQP